MFAGIAVPLVLAAGVSAQPVLPFASLSPPAPIVANGEVIETPAEGLMADAGEYARLYGVDQVEALRRLQAQEASVPLVEHLADAYRDRLAGIMIEHLPSYRIVFNVTGNIAPDTIIATAPFDVPIILHTGAVGTRIQALDAIRLYQPEIIATLGSPPGLTVDPRTGALLVLIRSGQLIEGADQAETAARLQSIAGVPVEVQSWNDVARNSSIEGGGTLIGTDPALPRRYVCTSGFVVTDGTQTALSTAAHCLDSETFVDEDRTKQPLTLIGAWGAGSQDVQLHLAAAPLQPLFRADQPDKPRIVTTWRTRAATRTGDIVCHRGEHSGYSCGAVRFADFAPPGELCAGPCPATWIAVSGPACKGGDSGGPIFLGSVAFGLFKGESTDDGVCELYYYMSVDFLPPGWTVMYQGQQPVAASSGASSPADPSSPAGQRLEQRGGDQDHP